MNNVPPVVKNLIIINVLFYLATVAIGEYQMLHYFAGTYPGSPNFYPWQVVSHMFMHGGIGHLFFNMFALFMFGGQLERLWGGKRFLNYYIICGLGGFFLHELVFGLELFSEYNTFFPEFNRPSRMTEADWIRNLDFVFGRVVGASGAVFGILLAFGMLFPNTRLMLLFPPIPIKAKYFVIGYGILELTLALENSSGDNVAHFAHLGGMLFGYFVLKRWQKERGTFY
ncbi:MAG: rhomboid family intramembrane serine protease [Bacteroidetes bacterium]|nr:rhomboid family intramembrane serine protease [Bacteroidota bacterium]MDA1335817.1 rhomboid family intramembrane serine protease [Bacteroidota bacterium]